MCTFSNDTPFSLADVELRVDDRAIDPIICSNTDLHAATFISLTFTTQKNGMKGEVIAHGLSINDQACSIKAAIRDILHLLQHKATKTTPLALYFHNIKYIVIKATYVSQALSMATTAMAHETGLKHADISARSLSACGAMALTCGRIEHNTIHMLG
jgi:hypothetical protein